MSKGGSEKPEMGTPYNWATEAVRQERTRQNEKWGRQKHSNQVWQTIAIEEFGEIAKAMLEHGQVRKELIQTTAVLVAWLEDGFERGEFPTEVYGEFNDTAQSAAKGHTIPRSAHRLRKPQHPLRARHGVCLSLMAGSTSDGGNCD